MTPYDLYKQAMLYQFPSKEEPIIQYAEHADRNREYRLTPERFEQVITDPQYRHEAGAIRRRRDILRNVTSLAALGGVAHSAYGQLTGTKSYGLPLAAAMALSGKLADTYYGYFHPGMQGAWDRAVDRTRLAAGNDAGSAAVARLRS